MSRLLIMVPVLLLAGLSGCTGTADLPAAQPAGDDPRVVSHLGLAGTGIQLGATREVLAREHGLVQDPGDCAPRLPEHPALSPVFEGDRLVLLWVDPPLRTPTGLMVGSPVAAVRAAHPEAADLPAPTVPYQFPGLIVPVAGAAGPAGPADAAHAYLFLHDQQTVQKLIVGYEQHARRLYHERFGVC